VSAGVPASRRAHTLRLAPGAEDLAAVAAAEIVALLETAVAWRGEAHLCLAGGSTPRLLHRALAGSTFDGWPHVHIWFGDERCVPAEHPDSNVGMAYETLLDHVPIERQNVHRLAGDQAPADAARDYDAQLRAMAARRRHDVPVMDALVLGMGEDGHTASLFPGSPLLAPDAPADAWCAAVHVPTLDAWRLTLTPPVLQAAAAIAVLVSGAGKHAALARVLQAAAPPSALPIRLLDEAHGDVAWFVDNAALFA
jgi:6-phosphogluconolactonase